MKHIPDESIDTWTEMEERRRLWWAVLILDRYVNIGFRFRPLCTPKIPPEEILPARDYAWDIGVSINMYRLEYSTILCTKFNLRN